MRPYIRLRAALLLGAALTLSASAAPPPACTLTLSPVAVRGASYEVRLIVAASCSASRVWRVRKSSTINVKRRGAPYQPIKPALSAWSVSKASSTIPRAELLSTLLTWEWQVYDPNLWDAEAHRWGLWVRIPTRGGAS